jgi:ATPase subunit of ABC transporter with duplicated ATPase domains
MTSRQVCRVNNLSFSFSSSKALISELSFSLHFGQKIALVGPNGCGKTSLLKLLDSQLEAFGGTMFISSSRVCVGQHTGDLSISGGEARIACLRRAFESNSELLLLDEPTNDLDISAREWFFGSFNCFLGAMLIISHDPELLDSVDEIWELQNGSFTKHPSGFAEYVKRIEAEEQQLEKKIESIESELAKKERKAKETLAKQEKRAARGKKTGEKQNLPKVIRGAKKRQAQNTLAKLKDVHEKRVDDEKLELMAAKKKLREMSLFKWEASITRPPSGKRVCEVEGFSLKDSNINLSFVVNGSERIHLKGSNGSGKSTLLKALAQNMDALHRSRGKFYMGVPFCLFDQRLSQFKSEMYLWKWFQEKLEQDTATSRQLLGRLGFEQEEQERPVNVLSGGEKIRIELALCVNQKKTPQLLLLDEPTNHLDLSSRKILYEFLEQFEGALIVVSHDTHFLGSLEFDQVLEL